MTLCAKQWIACVRMALDAFQHIDRARVFTLRYESLAGDPQVVKGLCAHVGVDSGPAIAAYRAFINTDSNHAAASRLDEAQRRRLEQLLGPTLVAAGYSRGQRSDAAPASDKAASQEYHLEAARAVSVAE
jgi:hypothetical protein